MTTAIDTALVACPLGCGHQVAAEGSHIHYCVIKAKDQPTSREYVGTFDGQALCYGDEYRDVQIRLANYRRELLESGALATATELDGGWSDDPFNDGPSQEEQAAAAAAWIPCEGGWEQYTPHPFDSSRTVRLFQPYLANRGTPLTTIVTAGPDCPRAAQTAAP